MFNLGKSVFLSATACALTLAPALAQPLPLADRTRGVLVADLTGDLIYHAEDLNGDGDTLDVVAGIPERQVFLAGGNASGVPNPTGAVFALFVAADGSVYSTDGDTDAIYRSRDLDGDGTAMQSNETQLYFSSITNPGGFYLATPQGLAQDALGRLYVANAGIGNTGLLAFTDKIYRMVDLDGDGTANGFDEVTIWCDNNVLAGDSASPTLFDLAFIGNTGYVIDFGPDPDVVYSMFDADGNGSISIDERKDFYTAGAFGMNGPTALMGMATDGQSILVVDRVGNAGNGNVQKVWALRDLSGDGTIDSAGEVTLLWSETSVPAGFALATAFTIAQGPLGTIAISSSGADNADNIFLLRDLDADGLYTAQETSVFVDGDLLDSARVVTFYGVPAATPPCNIDFNNDGFVEPGDLDEFITSFFSDTEAERARCDFNADGFVEPGDLDEFITSFFSGC
ncbi:MAG: EF-hand domain-containing protein [Phycisphaerales bacterium]